MRTSSAWETSAVKWEEERAINSETVSIAILNPVLEGARNQNEIAKCETNHNTS
jgi:hypothetical protein